MQGGVFLGLGTNMGDGPATLKGALDALEESGQLRVRQCSTIYRTTPISDIEQADFLNAVVEVATDLSPRGLLGLLLATEQRFGRERTRRWGPRTLDLDLLLSNQVVESLPGLEVPHPELHKRGFVLIPMAEIAPEVRHPVRHQTIAELAHHWRSTEADPDGLVRRIDGPLGLLR